MHSTFYRTARVNRTAVAKTRLYRAAFMLLAVAGASCSSSSSPSGPTMATLATFHSEVNDPAGDSVSSATPLTPPDLVRGVADVSGGSITFTIQFATGTVNAQTTRLTIELDTDQNLSTGIQAAGVGIDYILDLWATRTPQTLVQQAMPASCATAGMCYATVGSAALSVGTDTISTTVPLAQLGNASGRMNYRVFAYTSPPPTAPTVVADIMPDNPLAPAHVP